MITILLPLICTQSLGVPEPERLTPKPNSNHPEKSGIWKSQYICSLSQRKTWFSTVRTGERIYTNIHSARTRAHTHTRTCARIHTPQVMQWGRLTGALALLSPVHPAVQPTLEPWERVAPDPALAARVLWALPKPPARAAEKAHRRYCGDAARVLDCCRQTLRFARPEGLRRCLRAIAADPDASLVRVRARLLPRGGGGQQQPPSSAARKARDGLGWPAAGEVVVNLRLGGGAAVRLGLEGHVCELRLVLAELHQVRLPALPCLAPCPQLVQHPHCGHAAAPAAPCLCAAVGQDAWPSACRCVLPRSGVFCCAA